jgi:hypothetical protein
MCNASADYVPWKKDGVKYFTKKISCQQSQVKIIKKNSGKILKDKFSAERRGQYEKSCFK